MSNSKIDYRKLVKKSAIFTTSQKSKKNLRTSHRPLYVPPCLNFDFSNSSLRFQNIVLKEDCHLKSHERETYRFEQDPDIRQIALNDRYDAVAVFLRQPQLLDCLGVLRTDRGQDRLRSLSERSNGNEFTK